ncbi:response regulator transcription factor [Pontiella sulfatireligans]|uniref:Transcriptional regulatory protein LiaR n=1 Tax=Pontiella sulfatireligans TaxID=2750658 RepID=A0A6C2UFL8_9BACT|nr:response regulator transcription factor [Pontiella sulfatireligans]VGO18719.1 Transcriptional regulatory protein LiaR [Pontiella sulfatireligans]
MDKARMPRFAEPIKVWVVEDLEDYREDLVSSFEELDDINCTGSFGSFEAAEKAVHLSTYEQWPDVVLMDIQLPGINGVEAIPVLQKLIPSADVVILTSFGDKRRIFDAICAGASGYLLKTDGIDEIVKGLHEVHSGGSPLNSSVASIVLNMFSHLKKESTDHDLNEVELEVLKQLAEGFQKKEIAASLDLEAHQVNYHVRNIYKKLHTNSLSGAVAKAIRKGLI